MRSFAFLAAAFLVVANSDIGAQTTGTVTGTVVNHATKEPLPGAQVVVVDVNRGTIANQAGQFTIPNIPAGTRTVRVVLIGFGGAQQTVTVATAQTTRIDFELRATAVQLDAVVVNAVTGQAERKRELGTNTATINAGDIARAPITRFADVLTARAPGVLLQGVNGTVGSSQRIRIRGANSISLSNEPLIFIDGIQTSNNKGGFAVGGQDYSRLNDLNYDDIENVEILKGPAASALYGTAASNGVILITTRRGRPGGAQWRAYTEVGSDQDKNPYQNNYLTFQTVNSALPMFNARGNLNSAGYTFCPNESAARNACTQQTTLALNPLTTPGITPLTTGFKKKYGLSVAGGSDAVNYYVSGDVDRDEGVIKFNDQKKLNLRTNVVARVSDKVNLNVNAAYTHTRLWLNSNDNSIFSPIINAILATPYVFSDSAKAASTPGNRTGTGFGYFLSDIEEDLTLQAIDRFIVGTSGTYKPISWLNINGNVGLDYFGRNDEVTVQPGRLPIAATFTPGFRNNQRNSNYIYTINSAAVATFNVKPELKSSTTVGGGFTRELFQATFCRGVGIVEGTRSCGATSSLFQVDEQFTETRTIGGYAQEQLNWRDRVIVAASFRGDDNSAFGQKFGFITYPGVSGSWVISEEPFFPQFTSISNVRLRAAYGKSGQRPNFRDAVTLFEPVSASSNNTEQSAVRLNRVGNPDLKPERTSEIEGGFDVGLLQDRVSLEFTYFQKKSQDALIQRPLAPSYGLTGDAVNTGVIWDNLGSIKNWGTELAFNVRPINKRSVALSLRLSASTLDNRIENLGENVRPIIFNRGAQQHKNGYPTGAFFDRRFEIIPDSLAKRQANPSNGHVLLQRGDVRILTADKDSGAYLGHSLPTNTQVLSGDLVLFGKVTLNALLERRAGMLQNNQTEYFRCLTGYNRGAANSAGGQCSGVANPEASVDEQARFIAARFLNTQAGYLEKANFVKLREVAVTVAMPNSVARWAEQNRPVSSVASIFRGASITVSGRNLHTWTDYTGIDPEINESGGGTNFTQDEFNTQPPLRYYTIRLNLVF